MAPWLALQGVAAPIGSALRSAREEWAGEPGGLSWKSLVVTSSATLTTPALAWALRDRTLDPELKDYFAAILELSRARNRRLLDRLAAVAAKLNGIGVEPLLLKGAAMLAAERYPDPGFRVMNDIDLLVPQDMASQCIEAAMQAGFEPFRTEVAGHSLAVLVDDATGITLDLHHRVDHGHEPPVFDTGELVASSEMLMLGGARMRIPDPSTMAAHTILHAFAWDGAVRLRRVPLRAILDLAVLMSGRIQPDWSAVEARIAGREHRRALRHAAVLVAHLCGIAPPVFADGAETPRRILRNYARGATSPWRARSRVMLERLRSRALIASNEPHRLRKLLTRRFYGNLWKDLRRR